MHVRPSHPAPTTSPAAEGGGSAVRSRRRRRTSTAPMQLAPTLGHVATTLPPGSQPLPPLERGDQGVSPTEHRHAERVARSLFRAPGVQWLASWRSDLGCYELRGRDGALRFERWRSPDGQVLFRIREVVGRNPMPYSTDGRALVTLQEEVAAAGGVGKPVPPERSSYPDLLRRISQLFDDSNAPDLVYIPYPGADPNHPGAGSHGVPDVVQSRAPLIMAGPGIRQGAVVDELVRNVDVAPTVAQMIGVAPIVGRNAAGMRALQLLKWQDGRSLAPAVTDGRLGASPHGVARSAMVFVLDGASQTVLQDEIARGNLPNIARIMRTGTTFRNGSLSDYPTVTWANHNSIVTGASPGHHGLINNSWYDRQQGREVLITDGGTGNSLRTGRHMDGKVETIYEAVRRTFGSDAITLALNQPSGRGATLSTLDLTGIGMLVTNLFGIARRYLEGKRTIQDPRFQGDGEYRQKSWQDNFATAIAATLIGKRNPPRLAVFELGLPDNQAHHYGPHSDRARWAMQEADRNVGRVLRALEESGQLQSTMLVVTADHGMEHQDTDKSKLGGWFRALKASGVKTVESTRFVYIRNMQVSVHGDQPRAGQQTTLAVRVVNDDTGPGGVQPPMVGATVTLTDGVRTWKARTDASGVARIRIDPAAAGTLRMVVRRKGFTPEEGELDVLPDGGGQRRA